VKRWLAGAFAVALGALVVLLPSPPTDNSVDSLLLGQTESVRAFREFRKRFSEEDVLVVQLTSTSTEARVRAIEAWTRRLRQNPAVRQVVSAATAYGSALDVLADPDLDDDAALEQLDAPVNRSLRLFQGERAHLFAFTRVGTSTARDALVRDLHDESRGPVQVRAAGSTVLNARLDQEGRQIERRTLPLVGLLALTVLALSLRRPLRVLATLLPAALAVGAADRLYGLVGGTTNLVVAVSRPLAFVVLLASSVHLVLAFMLARRQDLPPAQAADRAARRKAKAIVLAISTTAVGFGSLATSSVGPIRSFGAVSALGLLLGLPLILGVLPPLLAQARGPRPPPSPWLAAVAEILVTAGTRRPYVALALTLPIFAAGAWSAATLPVESHAIRYFPPNDPIRREHRAIEASGVGLQSLELVLTSSVALLNRESSRKDLDRFAQKIANEPGVSNRFDPLLLLKEASVRAGGPNEPRDPGLVELTTGLPEAWNRWVTDDGRRIRLSFLIETLDARELDLLEARVRDLAEAELGPDRTRSLVVTGSYRLILDTRRALFETLWWSLGITAVVMQIVVMAALGSVRLGALALLPNLLPVTANFLVMKLFGLPLDLGTSMVSALALGIAVDDTLHFCFAAQKDGVAAAARVEGRAILLGSLTIGLGFLALAITDFRPTRAFGILSASAMLWALVGDLYLLPALLRWARTHRDRGSPTDGRVRLVRTRRDR
jgi:hypothetical protein